MLALQDELFHFTLIHRLPLANNPGTVATFNPLVYNYYSGTMTKLMHVGNQISKKQIFPESGKIKSSIS